MFERDVVRELKRARRLQDRNSLGVPPSVQIGCIIAIAFLLIFWRTVMG